MMEIIYLESALDGIEWMKFYYSNIFAAGKKQARTHIKITEKLLIAHPQIGQVYDAANDIRELMISSTPFSFIYRINENRIEVLRLWDQRGNRSKIM